VSDEQNDPFYTPFPRLRPPRVARPGELLCEFRHEGRWWRANYATSVSNGTEVRPRWLAVSPSEIIRCETGPTSNLCEHGRTDVNSVMKSEDEIWPAWTFKCAMRAARSLQPPANAEQGCEDASGLGRGPMAHAG
jgi:hypothetical protein